MAFTAHTVVGADLNGKTHLEAINILTAQLISQINQFNSDATELAQFETIDGTTSVVSTSAQLSALNPTPILQSVTENQLTGQLAISLSLPVKNTPGATGVVTAPRIAFGIDV
jgi:hypothetical protein